MQKKMVKGKFHWKDDFITLHNAMSTMNEQYHASQTRSQNANETDRSDS